MSWSWSIKYFIIGSPAVRNANFGYIARTSKYKKHRRALCAALNNPLRDWRLHGRPRISLIRTARRHIVDTDSLSWVRHQRDVCRYVCMNVRTFLCMYYIIIYMNSYFSVYVGRPLCIHTCMSLCVHVCTCVFMCVYVILQTFAKYCGFIKFRALPVWS